MRRPLTRDLLEQLFQAIAEDAPRRGRFRVLLTGGGTAVALGWREGTIDADVAADDASVFRNIREIIRRLEINIEFAKPTDFVPGLPGLEDRHLFITEIGSVSFFHFDPYSQAFSKILRGFEKDLFDAEHFVSQGLVDADRLAELVRSLPDEAFDKYPALSPESARTAVRDFLRRKHLDSDR